MSKTLNRCTCELIDQIKPALPPSFWGLSKGERQAVIDGQKGLLQIRRNLVELTAGAERMLGEKQQWEAEYEALAERLEKDAELPGHRRKHLEGRMRVAGARVLRCTLMVEQYSLEVALYRQMLEGGSGCFPTA